MKKKCAKIKTTMGRPISELPGLYGRMAQNSIPIGMSMPAAYKEFVENQLYESRSKATFQFVMRIATLLLFPIPGAEEETIAEVNRLFPGWWEKYRIEMPEGLIDVRRAIPKETGLPVKLRRTLLPEPEDEDIKNLPLSRAAQARVAAAEKEKAKFSDDEEERIRAVLGTGKYRSPIADTYDEQGFETPEEQFEREEREEEEEKKNRKIRAIGRARIPDEAFFIVCQIKPGSSTVQVHVEDANQVTVKELIPVVRSAFYHENPDFVTMQGKGAGALYAKEIGVLAKDFTTAYIEAVNQCFEFLPS